MNIIVTGASRGIGYALVKKFAENSNNKIYAVSRKIKKLETLASISKKGEIIPIEFDINDLIDQNKKISNVINNEIDVLINNAGLLINKNFTEFLESEILNIIKINFLAPSLLIKDLMNRFNKKGAHIVNIGSMGGFQGSEKFPGLSYYSASKAALASLTECLASEYKSTNLKINCLALGSVQTEMLKDAFPGYIAPLSADEMADFIVDFSLKGHKYMNGKIIPVAMMNP